MGAVPFQEAKWPGGEAADVTDVADEAGRAGGSDAVEVCSPLPVAVDEFVSCLLAVLIFLSMRGEFGDQLGGQPPAGAPDDVAGPDRVEQGRAWAADRNFFAPPGMSSSSSLCMPVDGLGAVPAQPSRRSTNSRSATVVSSTATWRKPLLRNAATRHRVRVDGIGFAALAGVEHPRPRRQLRRHVDHGLTIGDQALGEVPADSVAALDRPDAVLVRRPSFNMAW